MNRIDAVRSLAILFLCLLVAECSSVTTARDSTGESTARILPKWLGTYTGTAVYTYGDISDRKGGQGFPATLVLSEHKELIVFELAMHEQTFSFFFFLPPSAFTAKSVEFIRNAVHRGTEYQFRVALSLSGRELSGTMKLYSLIPSGAYAPSGSYYMSFTKQEP